MTRFLAFAVAATISFSVIAADEKPSPKLAIEYLEMSKLDEAINTTIDTYTQQLSQMEAFKNLSESQHATLKKVMIKAMGWETIKPQMVNLVASVYTTAELKAAIAFMRSKHGASINSKQAEYSRLMATFLAQNFQKALVQCVEQAATLQQEKLAEK